MMGATLRRRFHTGLTLLELVMALAVLAVLGTLALPNFGAHLQRQRLRDSAQALAGDVAEARFLAAQRGLPVYLVADAGPQWCWTISMQSGCTCSVKPSCGLHTSTAEQHPGGKLLGPLVIQLDPSGAAATPGSATFESQNGEQLRVDINTQGRSRICAAAGTWPQVPACR
jgi:type IV fimbrial biogenesis protein FimT